MTSIHSRLNIILIASCVFVCLGCDNRQADVGRDIQIGTVQSNAAVTVPVTVDLALHISGHKSVRWIQVDSACACDTQELDFVKVSDDEPQSIDLRISTGNQSGPQTIKVQLVAETGELVGDVRRVMWDVTNRRPVFESRKIRVLESGEGRVRIAAEAAPGWDMVSVQSDSDVVQAKYDSASSMIVVTFNGASQPPSVGSIGQVRVEYENDVGVHAEYLDVEFIKDNYAS